MMGGHACSLRLWLTAFAAGFIACAAPSAFAEEASYCVTCKNPDQTYVCRVTGEEATPSDALKLYCVIRTAKEGNHASCSAERNAAGCRGIEKVYSYDGPSIPADVASDPRVPIKWTANKASSRNPRAARPRPWSSSLGARRAPRAKAGAMPVRGLAAQVMRSSPCPFLLRLRAAPRL